MAKKKRKLERRMGAGGLERRCAKCCRLELPYITAVRLKRCRCEAYALARKVLNRDPAELRGLDFPAVLQMYLPKHSANKKEMALLSAYCERIWEYEAGYSEWIKRLPPEVRKAVRQRDAH